MVAKNKSSKQIRLFLKKINGNNMGKNWQNLAPKKKLGKNL